MRPTQNSPPPPDNPQPRLLQKLTKEFPVPARITPRMKTLLLSALLALGLSAGLRAEDKPAAPAYPLTTCVVSGEALGEMGAPIDYIHKEEGKPDRLVKFCCKMCVGKFKKDPAKYLAKLDAAPAPAAPKADAHAGHAH